jgi:hypothetical protein
MLKRQRAPSPSPTRPDPCSPPPLDNNAHLPIAKRRRTAGPIIDSYQRRDAETMDNGEDDYEDDEDSGTSTDVPHGKVYEHVNYFLHGLHAEHQHRSRAAPLQPFFANSQLAQPHSQHPHATPTFLSHRGHPSASSSPMSSPAKYDRDSQASVSSNQYREHAETQENEECVQPGSNCFSHTDVDGALDVPHKGAKSDVQDDERLCVTHRYEDTNRSVYTIVCFESLSSPNESFTADCWAPWFSVVAAR